ncbi:MAG: tetratricopeptide repeat protein [Elusimicrobia bacterium]|nr:tetratricopeptide repeat protein [Elusimicrobiota bacterium]
MNANYRRLLANAAHWVRGKTGKFTWAAAGISLFFLGLAAGIYWSGHNGFGAPRGEHPFANPRFFPRRPAEFPSRQDIEAVISRGENAVEADPSDLRALVSAGIAYYGLGREHAAEAINRLEAARDYGLMDARIPYYLGRLYDMVGLKQYAVTEYQRFLRNRPDDQAATMELARLYFDLGNYQQSALLYEQLLERGGGKEKSNPLIIENLALVSLKLQDWAKAKILLEELRQNPKHYSSESSFFLAEALRGLDNCAEALDYYREALGASLSNGKEIVVLEGQIECLNSIEPPDQEALRGAAQRLLDLDGKNKLAKNILKRYGKKGKKEA